MGNIYLLFNQRTAFIVDANDWRYDTTIAPIDVDEMHQTIDIFENCDGLDSNRLFN